MSLYNNYEALKCEAFEARQELEDALNVWFDKYHPSYSYRELAGLAHDSIGAVIAPKIIRKAIEIMKAETKGDIPCGRS